MSAATTTGPRGVPSILSANTGHLDLIEEDACFPLTDQAAVEGEGGGVGDVAGWGESSVEEIVDCLERVHRDRSEARRRGAKGAMKLAGMTWQQTADAMKEIVLEQGRG